MKQLFKLFNLFTLLLLLVLFVLPFVVGAQEAEPSPEILATLGLPPMLLFLIGVNNRGTQFVKLWLSAPKLPINLTPDVQRVVVSVTSFVIGIVAAIFVPDALSWLPASFLVYPIAAVFLVAIASSFGGALAQYILEVLSGAGKWLAASNQSVYTTSTTISAPPVETPPDAAKQTMATVAQAVKS